MKVVIGPYLNYWGPYQIAELVFMVDRRRVQLDDEPDTWREITAHRFGHWLAEKQWLCDFCEWIHAKRKRNIYVRVDRYDVWSMDDTLKHIIGPMLVKLKETKHGSPQVDDTDVPENLRSTQPDARTPDMEEYDSDAYFHQRWDWVLDEMIWVFTADHDEAENTFYDDSECDKNAGIMEQVQQTKIDREGLAAYQARKANAFRLFGKYYEALWD